jgi:hypothetical protein
MERATSCSKLFKILNKLSVPWTYITEIMYYTKLNMGK